MLSRVVNALSVWMNIEVRTGGKLWRQEYRTGKPLGPVKVVGESDGRGTTVNFMSDDTIFKDGIDYNFRALTQRFREMAYLTKGLRFHIADERDNQEVNFYFEGGIRSYVRHLNKEKSVLHKLPFYCERDSNGVAVEVALQYTEAYDTDSIYAFATAVPYGDDRFHRELERAVTEDGLKGAWITSSLQGQYPDDQSVILDIIGQHDGGGEQEPRNDGKLARQV